ncbi:MAG TPA: protoporphyrinogen oxidase [Bacteroidota bacterium]|nr:protoporphyrinogen oxidase [Bacteroidota bacterium]
MQNYSQWHTGRQRSRQEKTYHMGKTPQVVIIGGGITGLATAWWLKKAGVDVTVLEREQSAGGTMRTVRDNGWLVEIGPNSALETTPLLRTLFDDLGLGAELSYADSAGNNRYIVRGGELHSLPMSPGKFLQTRLWSAAAKVRILKEPFIGRAEEEETIAEFVERRLGREMLDYAINPFVAGVYAGSPEHLSVRAAFPKLYALEEKYGGLIKGMIRGARERKKRAEKAKDRARMFSFTGGMQTLPDALARALGDRVLTGVSISTINRNESDGVVSYDLYGTRNGENFARRADCVVTAVPAYVASGLVAPMDASLAESLMKIFYPPVVEVFLGVRTQDVGRPLDGFGFLVPAKEERSILGTIWSSCLFPNRAPEGHTALTTFVGGSRQPSMTEKSDEELLSIVTDELSRLMALKGQPVYSRISRWERAIPQYNLGHLHRMDHIDRFERKHAGLFLTGNYRGGISVGDCVISSGKNSERILEYLQSAGADAGAGA